jgi:hypothetical protein
LPKDRAQKEHKKATSIRKGGRATPGEPVMKYIAESDNEEVEK